MKRALLALLALSLAALPASARNLAYKGGFLTTLDDVQVESYGDDLNFMFAYRFSDGSIHLGHSRGIHTVTETGHTDMSLDGGKTWLNGVDAMGINTFEGLDGGKYQIGCWDLKKSKVHTVRLDKYDDEARKRVRVTTCQVELPVPGQFLMHRDVIRLADGNTLLATAYGAFEGDKKCRCFVISSEDDGSTWKYLSTIASDPEGRTAEGPDEATIFQLRDGRICAFYRDNGNGYLHQCFSSDNGATWTAPQEITNFKGAASPNGRVLADGSIVVISGRPFVYLLIDPSGTGKSYSSVELYHGSTTSYSTVMETAPNEILCIYDESYFGNGHSPTPFARIHASSFRVTNDLQSLETLAKDPVGSKCDGIFRPKDVQSMKDDRVLAPTYKFACDAPDALAKADIITIPERPHPVLRLVSHGNSEDGSQWALCRLGGVQMDGVKKAKVHCEFRLDDINEKRPQFQISAIVGDNGNGRGQLAYVRFADDRIELLVDDGSGEGGYSTVPYDIGTTAFHAFVLDADATTGIAKLYLENGNPDEPIVSGTMRPSGTGASIAIGDGSGAIYGTTDVSYIGWKLD